MRQTQPASGPPLRGGGPCADSNAIRSYDSSLIATFMVVVAWLERVGEDEPADLPSFVDPISDGRPEVNPRVDACDHRVLRDRAAWRQHRLIPTSATLCPGTSHSFRGYGLGARIDEALANYFAGTRRFSSSNQFKTTTICCDAVLVRSGTCTSSRLPSEVMS